RMPPLRHRETSTQSLLATLEAELLDAEAYVALADSLERFLATLHATAHSMEVPEQQRVPRLLVREIQVGPETGIIRHSIPMPDHPDPPSYLLRTWRYDGPKRASKPCCGSGPMPWPTRPRRRAR